MVLYKYRDISENTEKIFTEKKVWLSNATGLNDPFECTIQEIAKDWIEKEVQDLKLAHIQGFIFMAIQSLKTKTLFYDLNNKQTKEFLNKFRLKSIDEKYKTVREFIKRKTGTELSNPAETFANFDVQLNNVGIFSLSETPENQLMWAHYGDKSKGVAIGFKVSENSKLMNSSHCLKVNYSDELPRFDRKGFLVETTIVPQGKNTQKITFDDPTFQAAISTKPVCWDYEKEWRYVEETSGLFKFPSEIQEIIFGLKCSKEIRKKYIELVKNNFDYKIEFFEIITVPNTNKIQKIEIKQEDYR